MFCLIIPVHNEEDNIPTLVDNLCRQNTNIPFAVFVLSNCTDRSQEILNESLLSVKFNYVILQSSKGKWTALSTGLEYVKDNNNINYVSIVDADSLLANDWISNISARLALPSRDLGYIYGPFEYTGFERLPVFSKAYSAYNAELSYIMENFIWFGTGTNVTFPKSLLIENIAKLGLVENPVREMDLKICLEILSQGYCLQYSPSLVTSSGRRLIETSERFNKWCFYDKRIYTERWADLTISSAEVADLDESKVNEFFYSRSQKLVERNLLPLLYFYKNREEVTAKISSVYGINIDFATLSHYSADVIWSADYEHFLHDLSILPCVEPTTIALSKRMIERYIHV
ncbi:MAG: glycosyltransferase [Patescibacteria group bacterium]